MSESVRRGGAKGKVKRQLARGSARHESHSINSANLESSNFGNVPSKICVVEVRFWSGREKFLPPPLGRSDRKSIALKERPQPST